MKIIPEKFIKNGFKHILVKREEEVAIYRRHPIASSKYSHYEVVIIGSHDGTEINGNFIEAGEIYPSTSQWGDKGWTFRTLEEAETRFISVKKKIKLSALKQKNK